MIKKIIQISAFLYLFCSCVFEKPFNNTLLNDDYWLMFQSHLSQIAFDNRAIGAYGYESDYEKMEYVYSSDMWDIDNNKRLYFEHRREGQQIAESYADTARSLSSEYTYLYKWDADTTGRISGCNKYNMSGTLIGIEKYTFEYFETDTVGSSITLFEPFRIIEKKKYSSHGQLVENIEYTYFDDGSFEIKSIKPE